MIIACGFVIIVLVILNIVGNLYLLVFNSYLTDNYKDNREMQCKLKFNGYKAF